MIAIQRTNTILYCRAWAATVHFYREQLHLPVTYENDWFVEFQLTASVCLSIANAARASIAAVEGQGITLTWQVNQLEAVQLRLHSHGIITTPIQRRWGAWVFYCHDPEGHRLEFWADGKAMDT